MINIIIKKDRLVAETEFALLIKLDSDDAFWIPKRIAKLTKDKKIILNIPKSFDFKSVNNHCLSLDDIQKFLKD